MPETACCKMLSIFYQESSVASHRSEHLGDIAVEVNADNCGTTLADSPHLEAPTVAALPSQSALPMAMEVDIQTDHVVQSAQQNIVTGRVPQEEEREGSTTVTSAQPLQPEMRPSSPVSGILHERTNPDQRRESRQPEAAPSSVDPTQLFPVASLMFNHPPLGNEPLKNELHRLQVHMDSLNKIYELKVCIFLPLANIPTAHTIPRFIIVSSILLLPLDRNHNFKRSAAKKSRR